MWEFSSVTFKIREQHIVCTSIMINGLFPPSWLMMEESDSIQSSVIIICECLKSEVHKLFTHLLGLLWPNSRKKPDPADEIPNTSFYFEWRWRRSSGTDDISVLLLVPLFKGIERTSSILGFWLILGLKWGSAAVPLVEKNEKELFVPTNIVLYCQEDSIIITEHYWYNSRIHFTD